MAIKGIIIDLFGTLAREDEGLVVDLCRAVVESSPATFQPGEVAKYWWEVTHQCYHSHHDKEFIPLKDLELSALNETVEHFHAKLNAKEALIPLFRSRLTPLLFEDSRLFMGRLPLPGVVITNGDRADVEHAIHTSQLPVEQLITSEDVKSYKPRPRLFRQALEQLALPPHEVLMVGDSLRYDLAPARELGMHTAWVNRSHKSRGDAPAPDLEVASLAQLRMLMLKGK